MDDRAEPVTEPLSIGSDDLRVDVIETGASLVGVWVPDRAGVIDNVVLRLEDPRHYRRPERNPYLGSTVGRYANRILGGRIDLDGEGFELTANEGTTSLHGGPDGWSFRTWTVTEHLPDSVTLELVSPDGDMGFPGEVTVAVTYSASGSTLRIEAEAVTDAPTVVSMTNHAYWNLDGARAGSNLDDHRLALASPGYPTPAEAAIGTWDDWFELDTDPAAVLAGRLAGPAVRSAGSAVPRARTPPEHGAGVRVAPRRDVPLELRVRVRRVRGRVAEWAGMTGERDD